MVCLFSLVTPPRLGPAFFFFNDTATTEIYTLSLHDALPICISAWIDCHGRRRTAGRNLDRSCSSATEKGDRSEEHTSELQSPCNLVCRLLLEKKKKQQMLPISIYSMAVNSA